MSSPATGHVDAPVSPSEPRAWIVTMFDGLGFESKIDPDATDHLRLTRCPLLLAAHRHPEVVCGVHPGLVRGTVEEYDADPTGTRLLPFSELGGCRLSFPPN